MKLIKERKRREAVEKIMKEIGMEVKVSKVWRKMEEKEKGSCGNENRRGKRRGKRFGKRKRN